MAVHNALAEIGGSKLSELGSAVKSNIDAPGSASAQRGHMNPAHLRHAGAVTAVGSRSRASDRRSPCVGCCGCSKK